MNNEKILYSSPNFNVVERENNIGICSNTETVILLPFIKDDNGLPLMLGVLKEKNPFREGGYSITLITGTSEDEDPDYLQTAKRELKEESGYDIQDNNKWYFLGTVTASKFIDKEYPCFAIDVSDMKRNEPITDGSDKELSSTFQFIPANDVVKVKDVFIPSLFLKLFKFVVGMDLYNRDDSVFGKNKGFSIDI